MYTVYTNPPGRDHVAGQPVVVVKLPNSGSLAYDVAPDGQSLAHRDAVPPASWGSERN